MVVLRGLAVLRPFALPRHSVPILESLAPVAAARGDHLRAARLAGTAAALLDRIGARPPATAPMRSAIGARWQPSLSARGADRAWQEGMAMDLDEAIAYTLGDEAPTPTGRSTPQQTPSTLTRRQLEVAGLVAQGLTIKEIAARLFISERTAEGHIDQICNKVGFNSRSRSRPGSSGASMTARRDRQLTIAQTHSMITSGGTSRPRSIYTFIATSMSDGFTSAA